MELNLTVDALEYPTRVNGNGSKEMGRIGLLCHESNLHRFGIGSNGLGSTLKNAKFKGDNILISTQVHSTQFDLSQFDLSYSTKRVDLFLFDLFHSTHFMQSILQHSEILEDFQNKNSRTFQKSDDSKCRKSNCRKMNLFRITDFALMCTRKNRAFKKGELSFGVKSYR